MKRWDDVRPCSACCEDVLWDDEDARWIHAATGADHIAVAPPAHAAPSGVLVDVDVASSVLLAEGGNVPRAVAAVIEQVTHDSTPRLCPGQCGARWRSAVRRAVAEVHEAERQDRPVDESALRGAAFPHAGEPVWCADDRAAILAALGRLPDLAALVNVRDDGRLNATRAAGAEVRSTQVHAPSPSPAHDVEDEALRWAAAEAARLAEVVTGGRGADLDPVQGDPWPWMTRAVRYLTQYADVWLGDPQDGERAGKETLRVVADLERATGRDLVHRLSGRCPKCESRALTRADGDDVVRCGRCGATQTHADYQLATVAAEAARQADARQRRLARQREASA